MGGVSLAKVASLLGVPQYALNLAYGAIITLYAVENWGLLHDLAKMKRIAEHESDRINVIYKISRSNQEYKQKNDSLEGTIKEKDIKIKSLNDEINAHKTMMWRNVWDDFKDPQTDKMTNITSPKLKCRPTVFIKPMKQKQLT